MRTVLLFGFLILFNYLSSLPKLYFVISQGDTGSITRMSGWQIQISLNRIIMASYILQDWMLHLLVVLHESLPSMNIYKFMLEAAMRYSCHVV